MTLPIIMTQSGLQPQSPTTLQQSIIAAATALVPDLTTVLPASLIEDLSSTGTGITVVCDSAVVESVNNITPYGANIYVLNMLGNIYGVTQGTPTNTSVYVTFTGIVGYVINPGFLVSDGTHQYSVQDGGVIGVSGSSVPLYCIAAVPGTWAVPINTVKTIVSSIPSSIKLTCTNTSTGTIGQAEETADSYRARVLQAGLSSCSGMITTTKTLIESVVGVQPNLVSIQNPLAGQWKIIVGGGDSYQIAYAIYRGFSDISVLVGSAVPARNITVNIQDYPDTYSVIFVNPAQQTVGVTCTWNTIATNYINPHAVSTAAQTAILNYINTIPVGNPINIFQLQSIFQTSTNAIVPTPLVTTINFYITINGLPVSPSAGTGMILEDSESYFYSTLADIVVTQL